jgi:phosphoserine phosphatase
LSVLVVLDVDSTLIQQEVIELLAKHAGFESEVSAITEQAMAGEIDFEQSLTKRVKLLQGLPVEIFDAVAKEISLTPGALELIEAVHLVGGKVGAVSGGFSQILDGLAQEIGLDFWLANDLAISDEKLTGEVSGAVVDAKAKAQALTDWASQSAIDLSKTIAIGDGANDILMLQAAGFAVAFRPKPILRSYADLVIEENSLLPVIEKLSLSTS